MVSRQDLRDINEQTSELQNAIDEMADLYQKQNDPNITVDDTAYENAQTRVKEAVAELWMACDDMVDRTEVYDPDDEDTTPVSLPQSALSRGPEQKDKPKKPDSSQ